MKNLTMRQRFAVARGMLESVLGPKAKVAPKKVLKAFRMLSGYTPAFTSWNGALYEMELIRSIVAATARHVSKLGIRFDGSALPKLKTAVRPGPNAYQVWSQFLSQAATIFEVENNLIILPVMDFRNNPRDPEIRGYIPICPSKTEALDDEEGNLWYRYTFGDGSTVYMEAWRCGHMAQHQYKNELFGESNDALNPTMQLIHLTKQGIQEGIKNSATFRFMAQMDNLTDEEDLRKEMQRYNRVAFQGESGGVLLFPTDYANIKQIEQKPYCPDAEQMKIIQTNAFNYFGSNEDVVQSRAIGDKWAAFFDAKLEPFAIQLAEVLTRMTYTAGQINNGNRVTVTANRLQYASTKEKLEVSAQMADRGIMNRNEIREIWGLPAIEGPAGEMFLVRGEYKDAMGEVDEESEDESKGAEAEAQDGGEENAEE